MGQDANNVIEIGLSKLKLVVLLICAVLFVAGGIWLVKNPHIFRAAPLLISIAGYLGIVFFGVCALFVVNKLFDAKPGFVIDDNGIVDNSSPFAVGFIPWADVNDISVLEVSSQKFMMVKVADPEGYISRQENILGKRAAAINYRMYGSPVNVSANGLKISFDELFEKVNERWKQNPDF